MDPNPNLCSNNNNNNNNNNKIAGCPKVLVFGLQGAQLFQALLKMKLYKLPKYKIW